MEEAIFDGRYTYITQSLLFTISNSAILENGEADTHPLRRWGHSNHKATT